MTMEDFFTLTEMKNGLTTPARVEELISTIQWQKACTNNGGDATMQWSTVASTLACTENQDCLSHFVYLNGLCFLNQWLCEVVNCSQEVSDAEELINNLLISLEKLTVDWMKLNASGILVTIEKLFDHESADIKFRAQTLFERWNSRRMNDNSLEDTEKACLNSVDSSKSSADAASVDDNHVPNQNLDVSRCKNLVAKRHCRHESGITVQIRSPNNNIQSDNTGKLPVESYITPVRMTSSGSPVSPDSQVKGDEYIISIPKNDDGIDAEISTGIGDSYDSGQREIGCLLSSAAILSSPAKKPILAQNSTTLIPESMEGKFNMLESLKANGSCTSEDKILMSEHARKECKEIDTFVFGDHSRTSKFKVSGELEKRLDFELESGEFDALEIARLVAIEVEREVVDYREQSCSSSTDVSLKDIASNANLDIIENKQDHQMVGDPNENGLVAAKDDSDTATSSKNDSFKFSEVTADLKTEMLKFSEVTADLKTEMQTLESSKQNHKSACKVMKLKCEFDLNEDLFSENLDVAFCPIPSNAINLAVPIAVSASKGAHGWAVAPLHFEGEAGWRGSAATSAFRPASPRRVPDCEKTSPGSKHKGNLINVDLNVAYCESDIADMHKELHVSYCNPSRDSSMEVSSGRAARIHLDLNSIGDDEAPSLQSSLLSHPHQKGSTSLSPSSSSSSMKPSVRNFDLNDCPVALDGISNSSIAYGVKINNPFFTIMGANVPAERRDHKSQSHQAWMGSGLNWDTVMADRTSIPFAHQVSPPGYAYSGLGVVPSFPFEPTLYANSNMPRVAEARSSTLMPQLLSSSSTHGAPLLVTQPFLMSISSTLSSSNGGEPSNPGLDLNREARSLKQFFMPGHSKLLEEQIITASQHSTSGTTPLKRKEPD